MADNITTSSAEDIAASKTDANTHPSEARISPGARLWRDHNFNLFWSGQTFDALGDAASFVMIPLLVFAATGSVAQMGLVTATTGVGSLMSTFFAGVLVDRANRRKVMIYSDIGRAACYSLIPISWSLFTPSITLIYVVAAVTSCLNVLFNLAYNTATPNIVDQDQITHANGRLQTTVALAYVGGPVLAAFATKLVGLVWGLEIAAAAYLISAVLMLFVRVRRATEVSVVAAASRLDEFLAGARFLFRHPVLRPATLILSVFILCSEATLDLSIFRIKHDLSQSDYAVGIVFGIASIGAILAGIVAASLRRAWGFGKCFLGSLVLQGVAIAVTGIAPTVTVITVLATLFTFGVTLRIICIMSLRQEVTPAHLLGRLTSVFYTLTMVSGAIGTAVATSIAEKVGARPVLVVIGVMAALVATAGFFTAAHSKRPEEDALPLDKPEAERRLEPSPVGGVEV